MDGLQEIEYYDIKSNSTIIEDRDDLQTCISTLKSLILKTFGSLDHKNFSKYNDIYLIAVVLNWIIDRDTKQYNEIKQCISSYFKCFLKYSLNSELNELFISIALNTSLFNDIGVTKYLLTFCSYTDVRDALLHIFFVSIKHTTQFSVDDSQRYSKLNQSLSIESYCLNLISGNQQQNQRSPTKQTKILLLLYIINDNPSLINQLSDYYQDIFLYIDEYLHFNDYLRFFRLLAEHFEVNAKNKLLVKNRLLNNDSKPSVSVVHSVFHRFLSGLDLKSIILSVISVDSKFRLVDETNEAELQTLEFGELMIGAFSISGSGGGIKALESLVLIDIYRQKSVPLPLNLYSHLLEFLQINNFDLDDKLTIKQYNQQRFIQSLVYIYQREEKPMILRTLFKSLCLLESLDSSFIHSVLSPYKQEFQQMILSNRRMVSQLLDSRTAFLIIVSDLIGGHDQIDIVLEMIKQRESWNFKMIELTLCLPSSKESLLGTLTHLDPYMLDLFNKPMNYLLDFEINNVAIFMEYIFTNHLASVVRLKLFHTIGYQLFDKIYKHNPSCITNILVVANLSFYSSFIRNLPAFSYINRFLPENQIVLLFDKYLDTKWKVELSTVSKEFHKCCSNVITNNPNETIRISRRIDHVGSEFCLFKTQPLHLVESELKYIKDDCKSACLDHLESFTFIYDGRRNALPKNLKFIKFVIPRAANTPVELQPLLPTNKNSRLQSIKLYCNNLADHVVKTTLQSLAAIQKSHPKLAIDAYIKQNILSSTINNLSLVTKLQKGSNINITKVKIDHIHQQPRYKVFAVVRPGQQKYFTIGFQIQD
ncbi:hypothetical protein PPL_08109 [Heterostelium album PN500]|uniref:Uncharacterized protein n=1 Tax=Heterostelium pallidum (strain ATCC 26659 / Pp 5 / PN500) TaxID=670386 RepID=D3BIN0_HETP5|nr:hypothetical protein PPL_08109 [Heterostelium album PN500]EFA78654.1 hypothetical protein PPL_08109 [Heterostelium album PN500]|eukprot:XP_020430778.1 hypothetical protein PPL_08109 [Heterostelium album PN500]